MPMTLAEFLAVEPTLVALRNEMKTCGRNALHKLKADQAALVKPRHPDPEDTTMKRRTCWASAPRQRADLRERAACDSGPAPLREFARRLAYARTLDDLEVARARLEIEYIEDRVDADARTVLVLLHRRRHAELLCRAAVSRAPAHYRSMTLLLRSYP